LGARCRCGFWSWLDIQSEIGMYKTILLLYGFLWAIGVLNYLLIRFLIKSRKLTEVPTNRGFHKFIFSSKIRHVGDSIFYWSCLSYRWLSCSGSASIGKNGLRSYGVGGLVLSFDFTL
jgi:hypothetical protein